jgi:glycosyltransferase involved in cell wall biosynthesis
MQNSQNLRTESYVAQPSSLRIALVTETFAPEVNGVAMTLGHLVQGLLRRGHAVQLVRPRQTRDDMPRAQGGFDEMLARGIPLPNYGGLRFGLPAGLRLGRLWRQVRPDLVHVATEGPLGWSAVTAARKLNLPLISSFHTNFQSYSSHYGLGLLKTPIEAYLRKLHNRTMATLVPTQALAQELRQRGFHNLALLPRGVATSQFSAQRRSAALRAQWGVSEDDLVAIHVGRLAQEKNLGLVLEAYRAIAARRPGSRLVLVGDGPLRKSLQESFPQALFVGVRTGEDLAAHYASGDLFLFPSLTETYGNVVPEALASGLAVLAYRRAAAAQLITHAHNGMLAPVGDARRFIDLAADLANNPWLLRALRQQAAPSIAHLEWSSVCDGFVDQLRAVVERHSRELDRTPGPLRAASA